MPVFGGYAPFPLRFGESPSTVETMTKALNSARGSAFDTTEGQSPVWVENTAIARAIADVWATNERLGLQTDMSRTTMLARWEKFFGIVPAPTQNEAQRRAVLVGKQTQAKRSANYQGIVDYLASVLSPITFSVLVTPSTSSGVIASYPGSWYVSSDSTSAPACTLSGTVTETTAVDVTVLTAGARGTATYAIGVTTSSSGRTILTGTTAASVTLGTSGLTFAFGAGTYAAGAYYMANAYAAGLMTSNVCELTVLASQPSSMSDADYYQAIAQVPGILDAILPAYASAHVARDGSVAGSFVLDETKNLDNHRLSG